MFVYCISIVKKQNMSIPTDYIWIRGKMCTFDFVSNQYELLHICYKVMQLWGYRG